jgi:nucleoside-diphosphate-sugar epimerase
MRVLIAGCGYVGLALGQTLVRQGHEVYGLRRSRSGDQQLLAAGIRPLNGDITEPATLAALPGRYDWVVHCASSTGGGPEAYRRVYVEGACNLIDWLAPTPPTSFVYTSSTGVYGQSDGSTVDENSPTEPEAVTARVLVEAERLLVAAAKERQWPAVVLRVAGIYGPGRGHWFKAFLAGEARIEGNGDRILNMVHREDVAGAILAALERGSPGQVYNVADDEPVRQLAFFEWLSGELNRPLPPSVPKTATGDSRRGVTDKRVSNRRLKEELGYRFIYPTFREGYRDEILVARRK